MNVNKFPAPTPPESSESRATTNRVFGVDFNARISQQRIDQFDRIMALGSPYEGRHVVLSARE